MDRPRYEILNVIGRGGFGTVYRARRLGAHGFQREVALKILAQTDPDSEVLSRFRDESRLLGRLRHPCLPGIGPPVRLDDYWAVEMDLVEGVDCYRLILKNGPPPIRVVLEVIGVIAETLHDLYTWQDDPQDEPLRLIHRDIKPSNIMITKRGGVSLLDFGIAKASFDTRESYTTDHVGGTIGYMPPERVEGIDGPAGDVFSLGVVMHMMLTGQKPSQFSPTNEVDPLDEASPEQFRAAIALAADMRSLNPRDRPSADEVAALCRKLVEKTPGPELRTWARGNLPDRIILKADDRVGNTMQERPETAPISKPPRRPFPWRPIATFAIALLIAGSGFAWGMLRPQGQVPKPSFTPEMQEVGARVGVDREVPARTEVRADGAPLVDAGGPSGTGDAVSTTDGSQGDRDPDGNPDGDPDAVKPDPEPVRPTPKGPASVSVKGADSGWLQQGKSKLPLTGVPAGTYDLYVKFGRKTTHAATLSLTAGQRVTATCNAKFKRCSVR